MLLSIQQRFLLDILKRLGCVRRDQLYVLAAKNFRQPGQEVKQQHVDAMLNQLRSWTGEVRLDGDLVCYSRISPNLERLEAVDVMLELSEGTPLDFRPEHESCLLLRFILESDGKLRMFGVAHYCEDTSCLLPDLPARQTERIIFLLPDKAKIPDDLTLPYRHFFALRKKDGTHRFFADGDQ